MSGVGIRNRRLQTGEEQQRGFADLPVLRLKQWQQMFRAKQGVDVPDHRTAHAEELEAVLTDGKSKRGKELGDPREVAEQLLRWSEIKEKRRDVGGSEFGGAEACRGP